MALTVANALAARVTGEAEARAEAVDGVPGEGTVAGDSPVGLVRAIREGRRDADPTRHAVLTSQAEAAGVGKTRRSGDGPDQSTTLGLNVSSVKGRWKRTAIVPASVRTTTA